MQKQQGILLGFLKKDQKLRVDTSTKTNWLKEANGLTNLEMHLKRILFGQNLTKKKVYNQFVKHHLRNRNHCAKSAWPVNQPYYRPCYWLINNILPLAWSTEGATKKKPAFCSSNYTISSRPGPYFDK